MYTFLRSAYFYLVAGTIALYLMLLALLVSALHAHGETFAWFSVIGDAREYYTLGQSILYNHAFTMDGVHHEFFRTPGEPFFIAVVLGITRSVWGVIVAQIFVVAATAYGIARIGNKLFSKWVGIVSALLYVLDPSTIVTTFSTLSDTLFVCLLVYAVLLLLTEMKRSYLKAIVLGVICGYAVLVRPVGEYVVPILLVWFVVQERFSWRTLRAAGAMVLVILFFLVPWMARNYVEGNHFSLSSIGPYNFLFYNTVEFDVARGLGTRDSLKTQFEQDLGSNDLMALRDFSYSAQITSLVRENLQPHFLAYVEFHIVKSIPFYIGSSIENNESFLQATKVLPGTVQEPPNISYLVLKGQVGTAIKDLVMNPFGLLERGFWVLVLLLDIVAIVFVRGSKRVQIIFFALLALAFGILTGPVSMPRYRLPAEPFMFIAALAGVTYLVAYLRKLFDRYNAHTKLFLEIGKYFIASLVALAVDFGLLYVFVTFAHIYYLLAAFISFVAGIAVVYVLSIRYVFEDRRYKGSAQREFLIFLVIGAIGLGINELILWFFTGFFGIQYLLSKLISVVFVFAWNYIARKAFLFHSSSGVSQDTDRMLG